MTSSFQLRSQIEFALGSRIPSALSPRAKTVPLRVPCGISAIDQMLQGGLPVGVITELLGVEGSGRTSVALAYVSAHTKAHSVCAWIDTSDALDPEAAAANGVDLERLLWVRCGGQTLHTSQDAPEIVQRMPGRAIGLASLAPRHTGGGSPHPRAEGHNMPQAISAMLQAHGGLYDRQARRERRSIGTPGAPNRSLAQRSEDREEQVNSDRLPPRRGDNLALAPRCAEPQPHREVALPWERLKQPLRVNKSQPRTTSPWRSLDQALRATDLLLQGGGFSAVVLDLGSVQPEFAWRIPLATWFRFRAACDRTRVSLLVLTQHPCTRSSAELVVHLQQGQMVAEGKVMTGIRYRAAIERNRAHEDSASVIPIRKPSQSERTGEWRSDAAWVRVS